MRGDEVYFPTVRPQPGRHRPGDAAVTTAFAVRAARQGDPRTADRHHHDLACRRGGELAGRVGRRGPVTRARRGAGGPESDVRLLRRAPSTARGGAGHRPRRGPCAGPGAPGVGGPSQAPGRDRTRTRLGRGPAHDRAVPRCAGNHRARGDRNRAVQRVRQQRRRSRTSGWAGADVGQNDALQRQNYADFRDLHLPRSCRATRRMSLPGNVIRWPRTASASRRRHRRADRRRPGHRQGDLPLRQDTRTPRPSPTRPSCARTELEGVLTRAPGWIWRDSRT